jgi:mitochondrial import receptor subunit TOM40
MDAEEKGSSSPEEAFTSNAIFARAANAISAFQQYRKDLGLPYPGQLEHISREVESGVFLNNFSFSGLRADITKQISISNPLFQVSHQFSMGSQMQPPYTFAVLYGSRRVILLYYLL